MTSPDVSSMIHGILDTTPPTTPSIHSPVPHPAVESWPTDIQGLQWTTLQTQGSIPDHLSAEWQSLCTRSGNHSPFATPAWTADWLSTFAPDADLIILIARRGGALCAVLPLIRTRYGRGPLSLIRLSAPFNVHGVQTDLAVCPETRDTVMAGLQAMLEQHLVWDVIDYRDTPDTGAFAALVQQCAATGYPTIRRQIADSPFIPLPTTSIESVGPAKEIRRYRRRLQRAGDYTYREIRHPSDVDIRRFFDLESSGWKGRSGTAIGLHQDLREYYGKLLRHSGGSWVPAIHEVCLDGQPIAMCIGIEAGSRWYELKSTYDETYGRYGPGHVQMWEVANTLLQRGFSSYELLGQMEPYKAKWTSHISPKVHYLIFRPSLTGKLLHRLAVEAIPKVTKWRAGRGTVPTAKPAQQGVAT